MTHEEYMIESKKISKILDDVTEAVVFAGSGENALDRYVNFLIDKGYEEDDIRNGRIEA